MSFSTPTLKNPAKRFYEFKSKKMQFVYFDKEKGTKGENVPLKLPAFIVVLDELSTVSGWSQKFKSGGNANEVKNVKVDTLHVKTFNGEFSEDGLWSEIKDKVSLTNGLAFTKSVYALLLEYKGGRFSVDCLINLKLSKSALNAWIDAKINTSASIVKICDEFHVEKNGDNTYNVPVFTGGDMSEEIIEIATKEDVELQKYFKDKLNVREE